MSNMLEYNGYHAKIEFDADDNIFIGEVFGLSDSLNFHGSTVDELTNMFHQSIDNYLLICEEIGKTPDKEFKGSFNVRVSPETHRRAALEAEKHSLTLNQYVAKALEQSFVSEHKNEKYIFIIPQQTEHTTWDLDMNNTWKINTPKAYSIDMPKTLYQASNIINTFTTR